MLLLGPHCLLVRPHCLLVRPHCLRGGGQGELWEGDMKDVGGAGSVNGRPGMMVGLCLLPCLRVNPSSWDELTWGQNHYIQTCAYMNMSIQSVCTHTCPRIFKHRSKCAYTMYKINTQHAHTCTQIHAYIFTDPTSVWSRRVHSSKAWIKIFVRKWCSQRTNLGMICVRQACKNTYLNMNAHLPHMMTA